MTAAEPRLATSFVIHHGDALSVLRTMPQSSVNCCITSPPYWGLRAYDIPPSIWDGGDNCIHEWGDQQRSGKHGDLLPSEESAVGRIGSQETQNGTNDGGRFCLKCSAWLGCLGLEPTSELFIDHIVQIFRQVRRVLHPTGTAWVNMGDSYITKPHGGWGTASFDPKYPGGRDRREGDGANRQDQSASGLKPKDMIMIPARVAIALQGDGWYLRSQIPWLKANGMPGSMSDRPTTMIEYVYLLAKSEKYFYDAQAVLQASSGTAHSRGKGVNPKARMFGPNSAINRDRDPDHQTPATIRAKQNRSFSAAVVGLTDVRARRDTDWFLDSLKGMLVDDNGDPLSFLVNPQPFSLEMCRECKAIYEPREYRELELNEDLSRICRCGLSSWTSHFATFPEALVAPMILAGSSERGCCSNCGAPWERILEKTPVGDWNKSARDRHQPGAVHTMDAWTKRKQHPDGLQFSATRLPANTYAARSAAKLNRDDIREHRNGDPPQSLAATPNHNNPFPKPITIGWRPTCSHPLFPAELVPCTVLDPFSGTARTGLAAMRLGRNYIGIEMNSDYILMANWLADKRRSALESEEFPA